MTSSHNGRCAKVCWHSWSWPISLFLIIANSFVSKHVLLQYVVTSWIWMLFLSRHCSSLPDERFVFLRFQASSDDDNRSPFQLSLVHAIFPKMFPSLNDSESDNETISISWQNVLRWWMAQMRKDSWDDSLPLNIITCLLRSFRCYAYSFAALHCFSQSWFISGTPAHLHLQVRFGDLSPRWR